MNKEAEKDYQREIDDYKILVEKLNRKRWLIRLVSTRLALSPLIILFFLIAPIFVFISEGTQGVFEFLEDNFKGFINPK